MNAQATPDKSSVTVSETVTSLASRDTSIVAGAVTEEYVGAVVSPGPV
jgi:hypothetical protein